LPYSEPATVKKGVVQVLTGTVNPVNSGADANVVFDASVTFIDKPIIEVYLNADIGEGAQYYNLTKLYEHALPDHRLPCFIGNITAAGFRFHNSFSLPVSIYWIAIGVETN
jgi:hypothetical protein